MEQPLNPSGPLPKKYYLSLIIAFILIAIFFGGGIYWWINQKQIGLHNETVFLDTKADQVKQETTSTPTSSQTSVFIVSDDTMSPTYNSGDYVLIDKLDNLFERGEVIILRSPLDSNKFLIKRIIGLPGEKIVIADGNIYINDNKLNESYLSADVLGDISLNLTSDQYFVLGDNHNRSLDSRRLGPITKSLIQGKILHRISKPTK